MPRRGRPGDQHLHRADARLHRRAVLDDPRPTAAPSWPWAGAAAVPAPRSAAPPANGTAAGAGSRAVSPAGSTCTTSSTGPTAAAPTWPTWSACAPGTTRWSTTAATSSPPGPAAAASRSAARTAPRSRPARPCPNPSGSIGETHDADITAETIIPPWYGERLDLDHAIYICLANARTREEREQHQDDDPASRGRVTIYEPEDWPERIRQYEARTPRSFAPVLVPTPV